MRLRELMFREPPTVDDEGDDGEPDDNDEEYVVTVSIAGPDAAHSTAITILPDAEWTDRELAVALVQAAIGATAGRGPGCQFALEHYLYAWGLPE